MGPLRRGLRLVPSLRFLKGTELTTVVFRGASVEPSAVRRLPARAASCEFQIRLCTQRPRNESQISGFRSSDRLHVQNSDLAFRGELGKDRHARDVDREPTTQAALNLKTERFIGDLCVRSVKLGKCGLLICDHILVFQRGLASCRNLTVPAISSGPLCSRSNSVAIVSDFPRESLASAASSDLWLRL